ncbi:hypothetical protein F0562_029100 [Nyssa sinensis]|uniref:Uncharacterized protein n=1 Tax=Nyssa sinensis TaxID=561372 RepID=A0A5J5B423_9ASTE|nr:hypothetical protein F0562_029100 [Nyssa sinensis]
MNVKLRVEQETDEVYAEIDLIPQPCQSEVTRPDPPLPEPPRCNVRSFCKTLTATDAGKHHGLAVHRKDAEDCLPQLDMSQQSPRQDLVATDLHGKEWHFQHTFRVHSKGIRYLIFLLKNLVSAMQTYGKSAIGVGSNRTSQSQFIVSVNKYLEAQSPRLSVGMRFEGEVPERRFSGIRFEDDADEVDQIWNNLTTWGAGSHLDVSVDSTRQLAADRWPSKRARITTQALVLADTKTVAAVGHPDITTQTDPERTGLLDSNANEVDTAITPAAATSYHRDIAPRTHFFWEPNGQSDLVPRNNFTAAVGHPVITTQTDPERTGVLDSNANEVETAITLGAGTCYYRDGEIETHVGIAQNEGQTESSCIPLEISPGTHFFSEPNVQSDLVPWNYFTAYAESVPILDSIRQKHRTTFEHFSTKSSAMQASTLKELASYVNNMSNTTVAGLKPLVKSSKDLFHDLRHAGLDISWLESRFEDGCTALIELENLKKEKFSASERLRELGEERQELLGKLSTLEAQLANARNDLLFKDLL